MEQSTITYKASVKGSYRPQTQQQRRTVSSAFQWSGRKTGFKFRNHEGTVSRMRFNTEPSDTVALTIKNNAQKHQFKARSMSLLSSLDEMMKPSKKRTRTGRKTVTSLRNTEPTKKTQTSSEIKISIASVMILKHLATTRKQQLDQQQPQTQIQQQGTAEEEYRSKRVKTQAQSRDIVYKHVSKDEKTLRESFNKNNHSLYSRSRNKVFAVELARKKTEVGCEPTNWSKKFSNLYYTKYMKHYMDRKKFLEHKQTIKKLVCK